MSSLQDVIDGSGKSGPLRSKGKTVRRVRLLLVGILLVGILLGGLAAGGQIVEPDRQAIADEFAAVAYIDYLHEAGVLNSKQAAGFRVDHWIALHDLYEAAVPPPTTTTTVPPTTAGPPPPTTTVPPTTTTTVPPPPPAGIENGVYVGGIGSIGRVGPYEAWLGHPVDLVEEFLPGDSWACIAGDVGGCGWDPIWYWDNAGITASHNMIVSVPMLPNGSTLAQCANGDFDQHFTARAQNLVGYGLESAILRIGWEFNGTWYPWSIVDIPAHKACWQHAVDAFRSVPGQAFKFDWNVTVGVQWPGGQKFDAAAVDQAWPGDTYVDIVGIDAYDQVASQNPDPVARWDELVNQELGLQFWADFAAAHAKPLSLPEWGVSSGRPDGGGDNPYYIEQINLWIAAHDVAYHAYFDVNVGDGDHSLFQGNHPLAAAEFLARF